MKKTFIVIDGDKFSVCDVLKALAAIVGFIVLCAVLNSIW